MSNGLDLARANCARKRPIRPAGAPARWRCCSPSIAVPSPRPRRCRPSPRRRIVRATPGLVGNPRRRHHHLPVRHLPRARRPHGLVRRQAFAPRSTRRASWCSKRSFPKAGTKCSARRASAGQRAASAGPGHEPGSSHSSPRPRPRSARAGHDRACRSKMAPTPSCAVSPRTVGKPVGGLESFEDQLDTLGQHSRPVARRDARRQRPRRGGYAQRPARRLDQRRHRRLLDHAGRLRSASRRSPIEC